MISSQRMAMEAQLKEIEYALENLEKVSDDAPLYKNIGSILVKAENKKGVVDELKEKKETLDIRVKTLQKQGDQLKEKYEALSKKLSKALKEFQGSEPAETE